MMLNRALWTWDSPVWLVALAILLCYIVMFRTRSIRQLAALLLGLGLMILAYVSPIGTLADGYLFSAHMVQHLLLLLVIPFCLMKALPAQSVARWLDHPRLGRPGNWMPWVAIGWIAGVGVMWLWHVPSLCSASTQNFALGALRDVSFVFAGLLFWWPIYSPIRICQLHPLSAIVYLFSACLGCTLLGIYITFTTIAVCPAFANPQDRIGILSALYDAGFVPAVDQQLGGLLMWVPPCTLYVAASISMLARWYTAVDEAPPERSSNLPLKTPRGLGT